MFVAAARAALHLPAASASALDAELNTLPAVSWGAGEAALTAVATAEQAGSVTVGGGPPRSRYSLTKSRRYMLVKTLSLPPPPAPVMLARTVSSITLRVHGYAGSPGTPVAIIPKRGVCVGGGGG